MKIGFIGASTVAQTIAKHVLPFGHQVMLRFVNGMSGSNKLRLTHLAREFDTLPSSESYILGGVGL
jgi:hypothetical protein